MVNEYFFCMPKKKRKLNSVISNRCYDDHECTKVTGYKHIYFQPISFQLFSTCMFNIWTNSEQTFNKLFEKGNELQRELHEFRKGNKFSTIWSYTSTIRPTNENVKAQNVFKVANREPTVQRWVGKKLEDRIHFSCHFGEIVFKLDQNLVERALCYCYVTECWPSTDYCLPVSHNAYFYPNALKVKASTARTRMWRIPVKVNIDFYLTWEIT